MRDRVPVPFLMVFAVVGALAVGRSCAPTAQASVQTSGLVARELLRARADTVQDVLIKACAGESKLLGTIVAVSGASTTNASTATPFAIPGGAQLCVQCDSAAAVAGGTPAALGGSWGGTVTATMAQSNTGKRIAAFDFYPWSPQAQTSCSSSQACLAAAGVAAATLNCSVFQEF